MTKSRESPVPMLIRVMVGGILRLFPRDFRERFETDLARFLEDEWRLSTSRSAGFWRSLGFASRTLPSLMLAAIRLRRTEAHFERTEPSLQSWAPRLTEARDAWRSVIRRPRVALLALALLTVGLCGSGALFLIADAMVWRALPFPNVESLVVLRERDTRSGYASAAVSKRTLRWWQEQAPAFRDFAAFEMRWFNNATGESAPPIRGARVTTNLFALMGVKPSLGRIFTPTEDRHAAVAIVSDGLWKQAFGGATEVSGQMLMLDGRPHRVIGVVPAPYKYYGIGWRDVWVPMRLETEPHAEDERWLMVTGQLAPTASINMARAQLARASREMAVAFPDSHAGWDAAMESMGDYLRHDLRALALSIAVAGMLALAVTCASFAVLVTARLRGRQTEWSVRQALGANMWRLRWTAFLEFVGLVLVASSAAALLIPLVAVSSSALSGAALERYADAFPRDRAWGMTALMALAPLCVAVACTAASVGTFGSDVLTRATRASSVRLGRTQPLLVGAQVAFAVVLLVLSLVLTRSVQRLQQVDLGYQLDHVVNALVTFPTGAQWSDSARVNAIRALVTAMSAIPGVQSVSAGSTVPLWGQAHRGVIADSAIDVVSGQEPTSLLRVVTGSYFETLRVPILAGRTFDRSEEFVGRRVAIVNEAAAHRFFGAPLGASTSVLGHTLRLVADAGERSAPLEIVAIVGDERQTTASLTADPDPAIYVPYDQVPERWTFLLARHEGAFDATAPLVQREIGRVHAGLILSTIAPAAQLMVNQSAANRAVQSVTTSFGTFSLLLALLGLYAVVSDGVLARSRELAIRMAIGAPWNAVVALVARDGLRILACGLTMGLVLAWLLAQLLSRHVLGVDPNAFAAYGLAIGMVVALATPCWVAPLVRLRRSVPTATLMME